MLKVMQSGMDQYDMAQEPAPEDQNLKPGRGLLIWVMLVCLGWSGLLLSGPLPYQRQLVEWREPGGQILQGELWLPNQQQAPVPARTQLTMPSPPPIARPPGVILVHGVMANRDQPELTARCLARAGMAVLTFDLRGYGESAQAPDTAEVHRQDVLSALAFLRAQAGIDPQRLALIGHSMGATAVSEAAAEDGHLKLARAMGMHGEGPVEWVTGLYDALHPPGLFRQVIVSPAANHHIEWQDAWILTNHQRRLEAVFQMPPGPLPWQEWLLHGSKWLLGLGFLGVFCCLFKHTHKVYFRLANLSASLGLLLGAGTFAWLDPALCGQGMLLLLGAYGLSQLPPRSLQLGLSLAGGLWLAREATALLRGLPWILQVPGRLVWFPLYLVQSLLYYPAAGLAFFKSLLLAHWHTRLEASWLLAVVMLAEWLFPVWWLKLASLMKKTQQRQRSSLGALLGGLVALAILISVRLQQGYLSGDAIQQTVSVLSTDLLPTLGFFGAGVWFVKRQIKKNQPAPAA